MSSNLPRRIIIDCDPGHDDMVAIILALQTDKLDVQAITTVCGNAPLEKTTKNALDILHNFAPQIPVYKGAETPLLHEYEFPTLYHGEDGMNSVGAELAPATTSAEPMHAVLEIIRRIRNSPHEITLVTLGPMTNIALAFAIDPSIKNLVSEILFMGGSATVGNITRTAEFNIWADAEAAKMVINSGVKCTMFGLNVTNRATITDVELLKIQGVTSGDNPIFDILRFYAGHRDKSDEIKPVESALHDPCPIAYLIDNSLFKIEDHAVQVITSNTESYGQTLVDLRGYSERVGIQIGVAMGIEIPEFRSLILTALLAAAEIAIEKRMN